jgi:hypothetical protein
MDGELQNKRAISINAAKTTPSDQETLNKRKNYFYKHYNDLADSSEAAGSNQPPLRRGDIRQGHHSKVTVRHSTPPGFFTRVPSDPPKVSLHVVRQVADPRRKRSLGMTGILTPETSSDIRWRGHLILFQHESHSSGR